MAKRRSKSDSTRTDGKSQADSSLTVNDVSNEQEEGTTFFLPSLSRILSVVMLILGILAVGILFYKVMAGFFVPLFLAVLLVVIFRPVHQWIFHRVGDRPRLASLTTTLLIMMVVLVPIILVISVLGAVAGDVLNSSFGVHLGTA